jgi:Ca2+-binding RTX toxin-like protein
MKVRLLSVVVVVAAGLATPGAGGTANVALRGPNAEARSAGVFAASSVRASVWRDRLATRFARADRKDWSRIRSDAARIRGLRSRTTPRAEVTSRRGLQAGAPPLCDGRRATVVGTNGDDTLTGTRGRDVIAALGGNDVVYGLGQDDLICGDGGDDWIWAGAGNDSIFGGDGNDFLVGGAGDDTMDGGGQDWDAAAFFDETGPVTASLVTGKASGEGEDAFTDVRQLHGGNFDDTLIGDGADNGLFGNGGNDTLSGGAGNDYLSGGVGDDTVDGGAGSDDSVTFWDATGPVTASLATGSSTGEGNDSFAQVEHLDGGPYADTLTGSPQHDVLAGEAGDDVLSGGDGNDFLIGNAGNDRIYGGPGDGDGVDGGPGDDLLDGGAGLYDGAVYYDATGPVTASLATATATGQGSDTLQGFETIHGGRFDDTLSGGSDPNEFGLEGDDGNDTLNGGSTNEFLFGNAGNDSISGNAGNDFLVPGSGADTLDGGDGAFDTAAYWDAPGPITANLGAGTGDGDGHDVFSNVESLHGGESGDTLDAGTYIGAIVFGNGGNDTITGGLGDDLLDAGAGTDSIDGGEGQNDALGFWDSPAPITADLGAGTANGDGSDTFKNIEQLHGSGSGDTLDAGTYSGAVLFGNDGNDTVTGGIGNDFLGGGAGDDSLDGRDGIDQLDGNDGTDRCINGEVTFSCELPENLALGKAATASGELPGFEASLAVDGNPWSYWSSGGFPPQWIEIDLGSVQTVGEIDIHVTQWPDSWTIHRIYGRASESDPYTLLNEVSGYTIDLQALRYYAPAPQQLRFIRVETTSSASWVGWREIEVYGAHG